MLLCVCGVSMESWSLFLSLFLNLSFSPSLNCSCLKCVQCDQDWNSHKWSNNETKGVPTWVLACCSSCDVRERSWVLWKIKNNIQCVSISNIAPWKMPANHTFNTIVRKLSACDQHASMYDVFILSCHIFLGTHSVYWYFHERARDQQFFSTKTDILLAPLNLLAFFAYPLIHVQHTLKNICIENFFFTSCVYVCTKNVYAKQS